MKFLGFTLLMFCCHCCQAQSLNYSNAELKLELKLAESAMSLGSILEIKSNWSSGVAAAVPLPPSTQLPQPQWKGLQFQDREVLAESQESILILEHWVIVDDDKFSLLPQSLSWSGNRESLSIDGRDFSVRQNEEKDLRQPLAYPEGELYSSVPMVLGFTLSLLALTFWLNRRRRR